MYKYLEVYIDMGFKPGHFSIFKSTHTEFQIPIQCNLGQTGWQSNTHPFTITTVIFIRLDIVVITSCEAHVITKLELHLSPAGTYCMCLGNDRIIFNQKCVYSQNNYSCIITVAIGMYQWGDQLICLAWHTKKNPPLNKVLLSHVINASWQVTFYTIHQNTANVNAKYNAGRCDWNG